MELLGFSGGGISVLAIALSISTPANALDFTTFTDRGLWEAAVGGSFSQETFNSYTVDTSFNNTNLDVGDFTLNGTTAFSGVQIIDVPPLTTSFFNIDGTPIIRAVANDVSSFTATFDSPITAFGATFSSVSDNGAITQLTAGSDLVGNVPTISSSTGFFGFVANGSFSLLTVDSANNGNDVFAMDNVVYASSSTPVPFEVSPTLGLLTVGGIWVLSRLRQKRRVSKITK